MYTSKTELAWCAGLFDGEGSISIALVGPVHKDGLRTGKAMHIDITMTDKSTLEVFSRLFGGTVLGPYKRKKSTHRDSYKWRLINHKALTFLIQVEPYMHTKRDQAQVALRWPLVAKQGDRFTPEQRQLRLDLHTQLRALKVAA